MSPLPKALSTSLTWSSKINYEPIAVFVGGTSGVGRAMAEALHFYTGGKVHIIIIGRNKGAAEETFKKMKEGTYKCYGKTTDVKEDPGPSALGEWKREFIHCEASLMANVKQTTSDLLTSLPRINFLVLSAGYASLRNDRNDTAEGLAKQLALRYYSRWKLIYELMPLLKNAKEAGQDARAVSVLAATPHSFKVDVDDLGMRKSYSGYKATLASGKYNDYMMEEFAIREKSTGISFTHIYPGVVNTEAYKPIRTHWFFWVFAPLVDWFGTSPTDCAAWMWFAVLDSSEGLNRRNNKGDDIGAKGYEGKADVRKKIWEHTVEETDK